MEQAGKNKKKLIKLLDQLYHLRIFDPACGSGNFLIIAYKELCKLEIEVFKRLHGKQTSLRFKSNIRLTQFYGIELDDFAHETAKLSLWLAEHQMNLAFKEVFGQARLAELPDMNSKTREKQANLLAVLVEHYTILLKSEGKDFASLIRAAYGSLTNYLLFLNRLNQAEREVSKALKPNIEGPNEEINDIVSRMEGMSERLRREIAESIFR